MKKKEWKKKRLNDEYVLYFKLLFNYIKSNKYLGWYFVEK